MKHIQKLLHFIKPYWKWSIASLTLLTLVVLMDLALPRLIQRIIDQGINQNNMQVVVSTTIMMFSISIFQVLFALGNNYFSIQVGESVARDIREALFLKIKSFSFGNLVVEMDGKLYTPPISCGVLAGTFRAHLLETGQVEERVIHIDELKKCTKFFFVNSVRKWQEFEITKIEEV